MSVIVETCGCGASIEARGFAPELEIRRFREAHEACRAPRSPSEQSGPCGHLSRSLAAGAPDLRCELPAGHAGGHRQGVTTWGTSSPTADERRERIYTTVLEGLQKCPDADDYPDEDGKALGLYARGITDRILATSLYEPAAVSEGASASRLEVPLSAVPQVECPLCRAPAGYPCNAGAEGRFLHQPHPVRMAALAADRDKSPEAAGGALDA